MPTMLIADCEPLTNEAAKKYFELKNGFTVYVATSAKEVIDILSNHKTDIVVLDVRMADGVRFDILEKVKAIAPDVKIIVLSTYFDHDDTVKRIKELGADEYFYKPVSMDTFENAVMKYIQKGT